MRVLLDENVDRRLKECFEGDFEVLTVAERGWSGMKNGALLQAAEKEFDAFVTLDKGIEHQQSHEKYDLRFVLIVAVSNRRANIIPCMGQVHQALREVSPGQLRIVEAGRGEA